MQPQIDRLRDQFAAIQDGAANRPFDDEERAKWNSLNEQLDELQTRHERMQEIFRTRTVWVDGEHNPGAVTRTAGTDESAP